MIPYYDMNEIHKPLKDEFMSQVKELLDTNNLLNLPVGLDLVIKLLQFHIHLLLQLQA